MNDWTHNLLPEDAQRELKLAAVPTWSAKERIRKLDYVADAIAERYPHLFRPAKERERTSKTPPDTWAR